MEVRPDPERPGKIYLTAKEYDAELDVFGICPVQAFGTASGRDAYFRARHCGWSFDVADHIGNLPSDGFRELDGFYREGRHPNAGWMSLEEAIEIIADCLREYDASRS